jgi:transposase-like protein
VQQYVDGGNLRRIARHLGVVHQTVANWVAAQADTLPEQPPQPDTPVEITRRECVTTVTCARTERSSSVKTHRFDRPRPRAVGAEAS